MSIAVLGVDPSLTMTGVARCIDGHVMLDRFATPPASTLISTIRRLRTIVACVEAFAPSRDCITIIEAPAFVRNAGAYDVRCGLFYRLVDVLSEHGPVIGIPPAKRALYATGHGNASKRDVVTAMRARFPRVAIADDNVADALALCSMGARVLGVPIDGNVNDDQRRALRGVDWSPVDLMRIGA